MHHNEKANKLGFYSSDGFFQAVSSLSIQQLEFVSKSHNELNDLLNHYINLQSYEKCAVIRDEINKRLNMKKL